MDGNHYEDLLLIKRAIKSIYDEERLQFHANIQRWGTHLVTFIYLIHIHKPLCGLFVTHLLFRFFRLLIDLFIFIIVKQIERHIISNLEFPSYNSNNPYMNFRWLLLCWLLVGIVWICWVRHLWSTCRTFENRLQTKQCYCFGTAVGKGCDILQIHIYAHTRDKGMHDGS